MRLLNEPDLDVSVSDGALSSAAQVLDDQTESHARSTRLDLEPSRRPEAKCSSRVITLEHQLFLALKPVRRSTDLVASADFVAWSPCSLLGRVVSFPHGSERVLLGG
jgi:hypothetical protein